MKLAVGNKVILVGSTNYFVSGFVGKVGTVIAIAEKAPCPYQVKFGKNAKRWCKEDELEVIKE